MAGGDLTKVAGAGTAFQSNGVDYDVKPPSVLDGAAFQNHIKVRRFQAYMTAMEGLGQTPDPDMQKDILTATITRDEVDAEGDTLEGMQYILYRCIRHNPGVTLESMGDIVTLDNLAEVSALIGGLVDMPNDPTEPAADPVKPKVKPKTKAKA